MYSFYLLWQILHLKVYEIFSKNIAKIYIKILEIKILRFIFVKDRKFKEHVCHPKIAANPI